MAKINILTANVFNRIAAGEVVDRPYSVVKELVENAIDAGATEIEIRVENGGRTYISVRDNGGGIEYTDLKSLYMPHATSKISKASDLENITTLGFRGEAVASVAAVSHMCYTSKCEGADCYKIECNGGEIGDPTRTAGEETGTLVEVKDLFYNTPVRLKFLKSDKAEEADISTFVNRFILSHPEISFKYYANDRLISQSFGDGEEEGIVSIYGANILYNTYRIDAEKNGIRIRGYISNQNYFKPNRSYQSVFLNGRFIVNETIAAALTNAYRNYTMKRQYPFYVLHIDVPTEIVDVNVHPNKADVRFANNQVVYGAVFGVVSAVLDGNPKALDYVVSSSAPMYPSEPFASAATGSVKYAPEDSDATAQESFSRGAEKKNNMPSEDGMSVLKVEEALETGGGKSDFLSKNDMPAALAAFVSDPGTEKTESESSGESAGKVQQLPFEEEDPEVRAARELNERVEALRRQFGEMQKRQDPQYDFEDVRREVREQEARLHAESKKKKNGKQRENPYEALFAQDNLLGVQTDGSTASGDVFEENKRLLEESDVKKSQQTKIDVDSCEYKGNLFNTFLIYEFGDNVYIIDQHAAHERLIFDRLKRKMESRTVLRQPMLIPYKIHLTPSEDAFLYDCLPFLREMGFDIEEAGIDRFVINAVPLDLQDISLKTFFELILRDFSGLQKIKLEEILHDRLAMMACKAAVKGGMILTKEEVKTLLQDMEGDITMKCPHGRPVVVKLSKYEIEKMFKRIV